MVVCKIDHVETCCRDERRDRWVRLERVAGARAGSRGQRRLEVGKRQVGACQRGPELLEDAVRVVRGGGGDPRPSITSPMKTRRIVRGSSATTEATTDGSDPAAGEQATAISSARDDAAAARARDGLAARSMLSSCALGSARSPGSRGLACAGGRRVNMAVRSRAPRPYAAARHRQGSRPALDDPSGAHVVFLAGTQPPGDCPGSIGAHRAGHQARPRRASLVLTRCWWAGAESNRQSRRRGFYRPLGSPPARPTQ